MRPSVQARGYADQPEFGDLMNKLKEISKKSDQVVKSKKDGQTNVLEATGSKEHKTREKKAASDKPREKSASRFRDNRSNRPRKPRRTDDRSSRYTRRASNKTGGYKRSDRRRARRDQEESTGDNGSELFELEAQQLKIQAKELEQWIEKNFGADFKVDKLAPVQSERALLEKIHNRYKLKQKTKGQDVIVSLKTLQELQQAGKTAQQFESIASSDSKYSPKSVDIYELELTKDKIPYNGKNRILLAMEQIAKKRGFKLTDFKAAGLPLVPSSSVNYPFTNTLLSRTEARPLAEIEQLSSVPQEEIEATVDATVLGKRPELKFDPKKKYRTPQLKLNAEVVANALNGNAQFKVDNVHEKLQPVLDGDAGLAELPTGGSSQIKA